MTQTLLGGAIFWWSLSWLAGTLLFLTFFWGAGKKRT